MLSLWLCDGVDVGGWLGVMFLDDPKKRLRRPERGVGVGSPDMGHFFPVGVEADAGATDDAAVAWTAAVPRVDDLFLAGLADLVLPLLSRVARGSGGDMGAFWALGPE